MRTSAFTAIVTSLALLLAMSWPYRARAAEPPAPVAADPLLEQAKAHFEAGKNAYNAGDYTGAIRQFKSAEALRPSPILDYNIGLASERLGKRKVAVSYYQRYLHGMPDAPNRAEVEASIKALEQKGAPPPVGAAPQPPEPSSELPPAGNPPPSSSYDPYAQQAPAVAPYQPQPKPKRSLWWIPLVVVGGLLLVGTLILVAVYATPTNRVAAAADHALVSPLRAPPTERTPAMGLLFRF